MTAPDHVSATVENDHDDHGAEHVAEAPIEPFRVRLRRLREARNLIPSHLAILIGVTEGAVRQMESGQSKMVSFTVGIRLAAVLGVEPHYLAFGDSDGTDDPRVRGRMGLISLPPSRVDAVETQVTRLMRLTEELDRRLRGVDKRLNAVERRR